jgi:hypothetical protein
MANERKSRRVERAGARPPVAKKPSGGGTRARAGGLFDLDSEQSARLLIFGAVALVVAAAAAFLIFGYWYSVVRPTVPSFKWLTRRSRTPQWNGA